MTVGSASAPPAARPPPAQPLAVLARVCGEPAGERHGLRAPSPAPAPAPEQRPAAPRLPPRGKSKPKRLIPPRAAGWVPCGPSRPAADHGVARTARPAGIRGCPVSPPSAGSRAHAARPVSRAQNGQVLLLRGGDAVPPPAGDQRHAARGPGLPEGRGPDDREGEAGLRVSARGCGAEGALPAGDPPTAEPRARKSCTSANAPVTALLSSLSSPGW